MRQLGSYELLELLGEGGMGQVWLARHTMLRRHAAVKIISSAAAADPRNAELALKRFEREARMTSMLSSPHTIQVHDFGLTEDGSFYYAMEHLRGISLGTLVDRFGPQEPARTIHLVKQICESLSEAHEVGLVHRDIKPGNVFVCKLGIRYDFVKVLDFGLVKLTQAAGPADGQLTEANVAAGSPAFIPPEVIHGSAAFDARADIYSLGCVLYWLLTGQLVFEHDNPLALVMAHIQEPPIPPSRRTEVAIPPALDDVVMACLAKRPEDRPRSADELARLLCACPVEDAWDERMAELWWRDAYPDIARDGSGSLTSIVEASSEVGSTPGPRKVQPLVSDRPSLVVLPFENPGGDPGQDYFSEGISEDILIELSKFKSLFVIARSSAFAHKGAADDAKKIAGEFGVQYVVRGSVRRSGDRIRIAVQLIDAYADRQVWGERYDRVATDIFEIQDEVVRMLVATLAGRLEAERLESAKRKKPAMLDAYDCVLRGKELHYLHSREAADRALELFQRAIDLDPNYALAYCWFVCASGTSSRFDPNAPYSDFMKTVDGYLRKALALDACEGECHRLLSEIGMWRREFASAEYHQKRAIEINPNDDRTICLSGEVATAFGDGPGGVEWILKAMRVNPYHPARWWSHLGRAYHMAGQYGEALLAFRRVPTPATRERAFMVSCCVELGDLDGARSHAAELHAIEGFAAGAYAATLQYADPRLLEPLVRGLRAAGLPG